jgi:TATA-box binding protein (TBP) (component of TFIID and TFIIIB)
MYSFGTLIDTIFNINPDIKNPYVCLIFRTDFRCENTNTTDIIYDANENIFTETNIKNHYKAHVYRTPNRKICVQIFSDGTIRITLNLSTNTHNKKQYKDNLLQFLSGTMIHHLKTHSKIVVQNFLKSVDNIEITAITGYLNGKAVFDNDIIN